MLSVLICDDSPSMRHCLKRCLSCLPTVGRITTVASGEELLARYPAENPDLVLLDTQMPGMGGLSALRKLLSMDRQAKVLMLTMGESPADVSEAIVSGAIGYLTKDASPQELAAALAATQQPAQAQIRPQPRERDQDREQPKLTERERQVLEGMSNGRSNSQIGQDLSLSEDTVKTHARRLFRKLDVADRGHAVAEGFRHGFLS